MKVKRIIAWFRNDLRTIDNEMLHQAAKEATWVYPVYCFDPRQFQKDKLGFPKTSQFRAKFLIESVLALKDKLKAIGSDLIIIIGHPETVIKSLAENIKADRVYYAKETTDEEVGVEHALDRALST